MGTDCTTFLADLFLDTLEAEYIYKKKETKTKINTEVEALSSFSGILMMFNY